MGWAGPHDTARHLAEYVSLDAEMGTRLTQADNIREVTLFPRDLHRLNPDQPAHRTTRPAQPSSQG